MITICTVTYNALYAASLMWESYLKYHDKPLLYVFDQGSTDGTLQYFQRRADLLLTGKNEGHGIRLDELCKKVTTPYTLVVDSDVQFLGNLYEGINWDTKPFAIGGSQEDKYGVPMSFNCFVDEKTKKPMLLTTKKRFKIHCVIFDTFLLNKILQTGISFGFYVHKGNKEIHETGSMIYHAAQLLPNEIQCPEGFESRFHHWGGITNVLFTSEHEHKKPRKSQEYEEIKDELCKLRGHSDILIYHL